MHAGEPVAIDAPSPGSRRAPIMQKADRDASKYRPITSDGVKRSALRSHHWVVSRNADTR